MNFSLQSSAFECGGMIPPRHAHQVANLSPPLAWGDVPPGTRAFALLCEDPDVAIGTFIHWVLYDLPSTDRSLSEGVIGSASLPGGVRQGRNSYHKLGYGGPHPPSGDPAHRYVFRLFALSEPTGLTTGAEAHEHRVLASRGAGAPLSLSSWPG